MPSIFDSRSKYFAIFVSILMVTTGSLNTISAKWADSIQVKGRLFNHPFFQSLCMFIGEFLCIIVYFTTFYIKKRIWARQNFQGQSGAVFDINESEEPKIPKFNPLVFLPPACCDVIGTSIMYIGLNLTTASSFQMLRGSVIIFTGLLSVGFLNSHLMGYKWIGMGVVTSGLAVVGLSDIMFNGMNSDVNAIITGDLLIIMAQIIVAIQMVTEQKFLLQYDVPPLLAVGCEGLFGMLIISVLLIPMYFIHVPPTFSMNPEFRLEDIFFAFSEIAERPVIILALLLLILSIAFFNFAGITVTKSLSATTRMVLDSVRTLIIWLVSIPLFGEKFIPLQIVGFGLLILGMFIYNDLFFGPRFRKYVLPRMSDRNRLTLFCVSICGIDTGEQQDERLIDDEEDV